MSPESEIYYTIDRKLTGSGSLWDAIAGLYKTKDDSYVRIHTNFPQYVMPCIHNKALIAVFAVTGKGYWTSSNANRRKNRWPRPSQRGTPLSSRTKLHREEWSPPLSAPSRNGMNTPIAKR